MLAASLSQSVSSSRSITRPVSAAIHPARAARDRARRDRPRR
jgi:hypothetical protein